MTLLTIVSHDKIKPPPNRILSGSGCLAVRHGHRRRHLPRDPNVSRRGAVWLISQLRRAAVAIPSNIAEGRNRLGAAEFRRFVSVARGSVAEVETQLAVAVALGFVNASEIASLSSRLDELSKMLFGLYRRLPA